MPCTRLFSSLFRTQNVAFFQNCSRQKMHCKQICVEPRTSLGSRQSTWCKEKQEASVQNRQAARRQTMWEALRQMTGRRQNVSVVDGVSADSLNEHYAQISTDDQYVVPLRKYTVWEESVEYISEWRVFSRLITLDQQPQDSISFSVVPQARCAGIRQTSVVSDQPFDSDLHCTHSVESRFHLSCTKNSQPQRKCRLSPYIHYLRSIESYWTLYCSPVFIPMFPLPVDITWLLGSVRFSTQWFHYCCAYLNPPQRNSSADQ